MPDETPQTEKTPPPAGDSQKAEKYIITLIKLISNDKLDVFHTDLKRFDPSSLQDHYRLDLTDYQIEISHSKAATTGKDSYIMLFTNLKNVKEGCTEKIILAYMHLSDRQFHNFRIAADRQIDERKKAEEEKRFTQAMQPIDQVLDSLTQNTPHHQPQTTQHHSTHPDNFTQVEIPESNNPDNLNFSEDDRIMKNILDSANKADNNPTPNQSSSFFN